MLLRAIHSLAQPHLLDRDDWTEYHTGLLIYLMGALTSAKVDQSAKKAAFWAAATTAQFIPL